MPLATIIPNLVRSTRVFTSWVWRAREALVSGLGERGLPLNAPLNSTIVQERAGMQPGARGKRPANLVGRTPFKR